MPDPSASLRAGGSPWPRVSIVTPSFNQAQFLEETIRSVLLQGYPNLEYIIMDGGSTDGSVEIIRKYAPWLAYWVSEKDGGQAAAINKGFGVASGAIIGWINADDAYQPFAVSAAVEALGRNLQAGLVFADTNFIDSDGKIVDRWRTRDTAFVDLLSDGCVIPHQSTFVRREVFERVGQFDPGLHYVMDYDFLLRAVREFPAVRVDGVWGNLRVWEGTKTHQQQAAFYPEIRSVLERMVNSSRTPISAQQVVEIYRGIHLRYGLSAAWEGDRVVAARELEAAYKDGVPSGSRELLADFIVGACDRPGYLRVSPRLSEELLACVLHVPSLEPGLVAQIHTVAAFKAFQIGDWNVAARHAGRALKRSFQARANRGLWSLWLKSTLRGRFKRVGGIA